MAAALDCAVGLGSICSSQVTQKVEGPGDRERQFREGGGHRALSWTVELKRCDIEAVGKIVNLKIVKMVGVRVGEARRNREQVMAIVTVPRRPWEIMAAGGALAGAMVGPSEIAGDLSARSR